MSMKAACTYTHKKYRYKLSEVQKDNLCCQIFFPLTNANIVSTSTTFQYSLVVLYLAETKKEWKIQANWTYGKLNNQTLD